MENKAHAPICDSCTHCGGFMVNNLLGVVISKCLHSDTQNHVVYDTVEDAVLLTECEHFKENLGGENK